MDLGVCGRKLEKLKGKKRKMACSMNGCNNNSDIANIFPDKCMKLYNSVPYEAPEMNLLNLLYCLVYLIHLVVIILLL